MANQPDKVLLEYLNKVLEISSARARFVINFILTHGSITAEDLKDAGYIHGARAIGDVRDNGVPIITERLKSFDGKTIASYKFGESSGINYKKFGGRQNFPKSLKKSLIDLYGSKCHISQQHLPEAELQIDHRVPFYLAGEHQSFNNPNAFMLLSRSLQRAKSWDCENCTNTILENCYNCYWAYPENYTHIALNSIRALHLVWHNEEIIAYDNLKYHCSKNNITIHDYVKALIKHTFDT